MKITHTEDVDVLRRAAYPPLEEFADAYFHAQNGDPSKMEAYLKQCAEVKKALPKVIK